MRQIIYNIICALCVLLVLPGGYLLAVCYSGPSENALVMQLGGEQWRCWKISGEQLKHEGESVVFRYAKHRTFISHPIRYAKFEGGSPADWEKAANILGVNLAECVDTSGFTKRLKFPSE